MGTFLSNIQVFTGVENNEKLLEELVLIIRDNLTRSEYEEINDADSPDRSLILQVSSDRWISVYDQKLDEQDMDEMDALGAAISSRAGVPVVGYVLYDSDLLVMRLYLNGRTADTIINNLDLFNELIDGGRLRKRNGLPSKWSEVCAHGVHPLELKAIWERETLFADDALMLAAVLLAIPNEAVLRGYENDSPCGQDTFKDNRAKVLHFRNNIRFTDYFEQSNVPKMAFTSWASYAKGDVGIPSTILCGLTNQGEAFTGLEVLLWGPALEERLIEPGPGMMVRISHDFEMRDEWICDLQPFEFEVMQTGKNLSKINGYRYEFPEIAFPQGGIEALYPETAARLGIMNKWLEKLNRSHHSFQLTFTGLSVGDSKLSIAFVPKGAPEGQLGLIIPVYIGVEPIIAREDYSRKTLKK